MLTIEEIEKDYSEFKTDKPYVSNALELFAYIEIGLDNLLENQKVALKESAYINKDKFMIKLIDFITFRKVSEDNDLAFLEADSKAVNKAIELADLEASYLEKIAELITEENVQELLKLVDFSSKYYNINSDYIDYLRDVYETQRNGFSMFNPSKQDYTEVFDKFMQKKLSEIAKVTTKPVEKNKKI